MSLDIVKVRGQVATRLREHGYKPRDADPADFQFEDDRTLRFKVGTQYGEVAISVWWNDERAKDVIRITQEAQVAEALHAIDALVQSRAAGREVEPITDVKPDDDHWRGPVKSIGEQLGHEGGHFG